VSPAGAGRGQTKRLKELKDQPPLQDGEIINGVEVIRVGTATFTRASHWRRALSYLTLYPQLMWQVWKLGRVDAVVSMTDPPLQVAAVTLASCRAKRKVHWAQDVYPELAEELGVIVRGGLFAGVLRAVSTWALRRQDEIVVVGRCMRERLIARGIDAGKIEVIPNWSPVAAVPADEAAAMRRKLGWEEEFVALYSGNIGLAHDFETLVGAAKLLEGSGVRMVFAGEGPRLEEVRRATAGLAQVTFLRPQPKEELGAFLAAADVHLVTVRAGLEGLVVPSKAYGILAAGLPVMYVGSADSEIAKLLNESGAGRVFPNGDARGLAEALKSASAASDTFQRIGAAAMRSAGGWTFAKALAKWREVVAEE
jgi:glycosyltransferase involved in cell wall biosynthesis